MIVAFRVDGNKKLGLGHIKRCITLAKSLQKRNIACFFITQFKGSQEFLKSKGFEVFIIKQRNESKQIRNILLEKKCQKLIIDSKRKSIRKILQKLDKKIIKILIDNLTYSNLADLVVLSSVKDPKKNYPENCIVGLKYLLHGIENIPKSVKPKNNSILLSMGGSDKYNITRKIVSSFSKRRENFDLVLVLGKFYDDEKSLLKIIKNDKRFHVVKSPTSLAALMQHASIGIVTFGITVYEAGICKMPAFVISHSNENDIGAKLVENYGWISYMGKYDKIDYDNLTTSVLNLLQNKIELKNMTQACLQIDGLGPSRVAELIINLQ